MDDNLGSDHFPLIITVSIKRYLYNKQSFEITSVRTNWNELDSLLEGDYDKFLSFEYENLSPSKKCKYFVKIITENFEKITPKKRQVHPKNHKNPVRWWDSECDKGIRLRKATFEEWQHIPSTENLINYKKKPVQSRGKQ